MAAVNLLISRFTVTITKGTAVADATIGTVGGAVVGVSAQRIRDTGPKSTYEVIVVHDDGTPIALQYSVKTVTLAENTTPVLDAVLDTVNGAVQGISIDRRAGVGVNNDFDIFVVHLSA